MKDSTEVNCMLSLVSIISISFIEVLIVITYSKVLSPVNVKPFSLNKIDSDKRYECISSIGI